MYFEEKAQRTPESSEEMVRPRKWISDAQNVFFGDSTSLLDLQRLRKRAKASGMSAHEVAQHARSSTYMMTFSKSAKASATLELKTAGLE